MLHAACVRRALHQVLGESNWSMTPEAERVIRRYLGRVDGQIKSRSFRLELGEIKAVLAAVPGVDEVAVTMQVSAVGMTASADCICFA